LDFIHWKVAAHSQSLFLRECLAYHEKVDRIFGIPIYHESQVVEGGDFQLVISVGKCCKVAYDMTMAACIVVIAHWVTHLRVWV
jgi:hypothetical protein